MLVYQAEASECGIACLSMISNFHGGGIELKTLRESSRAGSRGLNLIQLINLASSYSLSSRPIKTSMDGLKNAQLPCIVHWDLDHFVVLKKIRGRKYTVLDPSYGEIILNAEEFSKHFTGVILEVLPDEGFEKVNKKRKLSVFQVLNGLQRLLPSFIQVIVLSLLFQLFVLIAPFYLQTITDNAIASSDVGLIVSLALGFSIVLLLQLVTNAVRGGIVIFVSNLLNVELCSRLFKHLLRLPMDYFSNRHVGDTISRFESLRQIKNVLTTSFAESFIDGLFSLIGIVILFSYSFELSLVVILGVLTIVIIRIVWFPIYQNSLYKVISTSANESTGFIESLKAIQTIKLFGMEDSRALQWKNALIDTTNSNVKLEKQQLFYQTGEKFISGLENILVIGLAASYVIDAKFTLGMMIAFLAYKTLFVGMILGFIENLFVFKTLRLHLERLSDITDSQLEEGVDDTSEVILKGGIKIEDMSFRYSPDEELLLENISFEVEPGESVAITGASGRGKTTLLKLMLSLISAEKGRLLLDGVPLAKIGKKSYRNQIASVMQDDQLLIGTIKDNIALFDVDADEEWVIKCAEKAAIHEEIMKLPMGYSTHIGDMGGALSGGQKQRVLLARALYRKPRILFLDEATSHLDVITEKKVNEAIKSLNITRIIIAHRPETISSADRVFNI